MNIGWIVLYCLLSVIQLYIFMAIGMISYFKKIYTAKSLKILSELVMRLFLPVYAIVEVARMATFENITISWLLFLSVIVSIICGFVISYTFSLIFKLDRRTALTFSFFESLPSLGTLPLVLGRAFVFLVVL